MQNFAFALAKLHEAHLMKVLSRITSILALIVLILTGVIFVVANLGLCLGFLMETVLITLINVITGCFSYC